MPKSEITSVTVSHLWDDESRSDTKIFKGNLDSTGPYVAIEQDGQIVYIRPESWEDIQGQIESMLNPAGA